MFFFSLQYQLLTGQMEPQLFELLYPFHARKKISALCHRNKDNSTVPGPSIVRSPSATVQNITALLALSINHTPYNAVVSAFNLFGRVAIIQVR